jgi:HD-GYP domain-containing protein (c-di-GMP phosphodiesterase class II)
LSPTETNPAKFAPIPIGKINPDEPLCADVYLKIGDKFIKFKEQEDAIPSEKYNFFISKNLKDLFVLTEDVKKVMDWLKASKAKLVEEVVEQIGEEHRELAEKREEIKEVVFETFADLELDSGTVTILQDQVADFIDDIGKKKVPQLVLAKLTRQSHSVADHSVNVANIAVYMAMLLGHGHQFVLENIYMGSILHDYAKAKIPEDILKNTGNQKYNQAIQDHPKKAGQMIAKIEGINKQIITIVEQHHEQHNGKGYPKGLAGDDIYELSKIVTMANVFDNILVENINKSEKQRNRAAIKFFEYDKGKQFDPEIIEKIIDGLKLAYGGYTKAPSKKEKIELPEDEVFSVDDDDEKDS